jgi:hypothetical protein
MADYYSLQLLKLFVYLFAALADWKAIWVSCWYPYLSAESDNRNACNDGFYDVCFVCVVSELVVIARNVCFSVCALCDFHLHILSLTGRTPVESP